MSRTAQLPPPDEPAERLAAEMASAWRRGERLSVEDYLTRHPELLDQPEQAVRLIYEEVCLRQELGEEPSPEELLGRFPRWADELAILLDCHQLLRARLGPPEFPAPGESLGDFRLLAELGRGRRGRVFLATQPSLADRPVVLKVMPRRDREFLSLARLQHTHIIPLHGAHDFPARNVRALCQPYLGGATLARLLELLGPVPAPQRSGRLLVEALDQANRDSARTMVVGKGGPREVLARVPYPEAVCWVGACLAEGLQHAHERGLVHLDLKPSNVLLAADGQPLLLDFHLALHPLAAGQAVEEWFGGTPGYMSPEQARVWEEVQHGGLVPEPVEGRSDIYSLGRLLYVALGGDEGGCDPLPRLNTLNGQVSVGLSDIVHRCLASRADDRYPDAATLRDDLRRHLAHLPLRGVPNRSLRERWVKWRRRRPHAPLWAALLLALMAGGALLAAEALERNRDAHAALAEAEGQMQRGAYRDAVRTLARGRARLDGLPGHGSLVREVDARMREARRAQAAKDLHAVAESLRLLVGAEVQSAGELQALEAHCRTVWEARGLVLDGTALAPEADEQVRANLTDVALLWVDLRGRRARRGEAEFQEEARRVLAEAEELLGPSPALARERHALAGEADAHTSQNASTPWDHVILGRSLLRSGQLERARQELERAAELRPQDFWANFYHGVCAYRLGQHAEAVHSFGVAIALAPRSAESYYNRALARAAWGKTTLALRDYDRALELAPHLGAAALNRGVLHHQEGRHSLAKADLERALRDGAEPALAHYNLALIHLALQDEPAVRRHLEHALEHDPGHAPARSLLQGLHGSR